MRLLGPAIVRNVILLQSAWRSSICRRFYTFFNKTLWYTQITELCGIQPGLQLNVEIRLGVSSFPLSLYYRADFPSSIKASYSTDCIVHADRQGWRVVDRERFIGQIRQQFKLKKNAHRRKTSKCPSTRRRATKGDPAEIRRERIRKNSRRKFKWFYDKEVKSDEPEINHEAVKENNEDSDLEVMSWLKDLDLNNVRDDF